MHINKLTAVAALAATSVAGLAVPEPFNNNTLVSRSSLTVPPGLREPVSAIKATHNKLNEFDMDEAIKCLEDWCAANGGVEKHGKVRCIRGSAIAYMCNYGDWNPCDGNEMRTARNIFIAEASHNLENTGWVYYGDWAKTYGFDAFCPRNECDLGFNERDNKGEGEACPNTKRQIWQYSNEQHRKPPPPPEPEPVTPPPPPPEEWSPLPYAPGGPVVVDVGKEDPRASPAYEGVAATPTPST